MHTQNISAGMRRWICVLLSLVGISMFAQPMLVDIEMEKIPQKKVRAYLGDQIDDSKVFFTDIEPSCNSNTEMQTYNKVEHIFRVNADIETTWQAYKGSSMVEAWTSKNVSFGVLFQKWSDMVLYHNDADYSAGVDTGQVFLLNLRVLKGIFNLAVGMEIVEVDSLKSEIKFSYLKGNKSEGTQTIKFVEQLDGTTQIIHTSEFQSGSHFRDRRIYPFFHQRLIIEFHENILSGTTTDEKDSLVLLARHYDLN